MTLELDDPADLVDVAVIGAGVVGAAVAQRLAAPGRSCWLVDRGERVGGEVTERNSGVIHAGLYYPAGSLKTRLCIEGNRALYEWAQRAGIPHLRCGKLIVALDEAEEALAIALFDHARSVGVEGLELLGAAGIARLEPSLAGRMAVHSTATGIVDPAELTRSLAASAVARGAELILGARVEAIEERGSVRVLRTTRGSIGTRAIVNAAGLCADDVARLAGVAKYTIHPCRGDYFRLATRRSYRHLIYPVKKAGAPGLGVHLTIDLGGSCRLGPDAFYVESKSDYGPAGDKRAAFAAAARRLLGGVDEADLAYDTCGIRPKLRAPHEREERDFVIAEDLPRFVNLVGIESPGLTAALAIAAEVERILFP